MRIAIDMTYPYKIKTGTRVYACNLLETMKKLNPRNEYILLTAPSFKRKDLLSKISNIIIDFGWRQIILPYKLKRQKVNVLHSPSFFAPWILSCSSVITIHDASYLYYPQGYNPLWLFYFKHSVTLGMKRANKIIAVSKHTKKDILRNFTISAEKIEVIYEGVTQKFASIRNNAVKCRFRKKYKLDDEIILFVSELNFRKNIPTLLNAYYLFKNKHSEFKTTKYKLVLCGQKGKVFNAKILSQTEELNLKNDVIFLDHIPDDDLPLLYNVATLFIFPSLYEGFGLPPLEAMACGCPVIASNTSSLPEVIGEAGILVDPLDAQGFANAMNRITTDDSLRKELIKKGIERARLFSWEKAAKETLAVYRQVCT